VLLWKEYERKLLPFSSDLGIVFDIVYLWIYLMNKLLQRKSGVFNRFKSGEYEGQP